MLDFDNTIVPYTTNTPTNDVLAWIKELQQSGITFCVVSNSRKMRVREFCRLYDIDCITHAKKPFHRGIDRCLKKYGVSRKESALVGDQIYTDVLGANTSGVTSILVQAIHNHNFLLKLRHIAELPFILPVWKRRFVGREERTVEK